MTDANNLEATMQQLGNEAKVASRLLAKATGQQKTDALLAAAASLDADRAKILSANEIDLKNAVEKQLSDSMVDRLRLDDGRVDGMIAGIKSIAGLNDPVGRVLSEWDRPNGLAIQRVSTPLGVIGVIYESRPNVTADAGALCLMSGNAVILRGGSDSFHSSTAIHQAMQTGIASVGLPEAAIQLVPAIDRDAVGMILASLNGCVDVVVPRGGRSLVERVQNESRVPVFAHLEGICHVYVDQSADLEIAKLVVLNAKMRRTGICGAAETLLIDKAVADSHLLPLVTMLHEAGCAVRGDEAVVGAFASAAAATEEDWSTEYLDAIISVKVVDGIGGAIAHIGQYSSGHTEAVIAEDVAVVERFFNEIDSAILMHNASTQFADGGEFGMGAEIGIATGKMHARGPVGVEQLTSFKYCVHGNGQVRP